MATDKSQILGSPNEENVTRFEEAAPESAPAVWKELLTFALENKKWWLLPIFVFLGLLGVIMVFGTTGAAPFIYTLF